MKNFNFYLTLIFLCMTNQLFALSIYIDGREIWDNGGLDIDETADVIVFNSSHPTKGFTTSQGYNVSGKVHLMSGGSTVGLTHVVTLTDFRCVRPGEVAGGRLSIYFQHIFDKNLPAPPIVAADAIRGDHINVIPPFVLGPGNKVEFQGEVDTKLIKPPDGYVISEPPGGPTPINIGPQNGHGIMSIEPQESHLVVGKLHITLGTTGDGIRLPNSAEVGIGTDQPLPVELSSFTSAVNKNEVTLNWITSAEVNNSRFEIERKPVNSDDWSIAGSVRGNGTTSEPKNYTFFDRNLSSGKYNFRLKQVDFNGNYEYFNLSGDVIVGFSKDYRLSQNFPNPFNPTTTISYEIPVAGNVTLKIYDVTGKQIATFVNQNQDAGYYTLDFDGSKYASGIYFYKLTAGDFVEMKKMVLLK